MSQPRAPDPHHCGGQISSHAVDHLYLCDQHTVNHYFHSADYAEGEFNPLYLWLTYLSMQQWLPLLSADIVI